MSGSNVTSLHTLFDAVREKYSISLDPLVMGKVSMKDLMDCYGLEAFKIGFNGNDLCHNVFPRAVNRWVMGENENIPLVLSYDPISDEFSTLMNSYIVNSAVRFMDGQFPVLLHPGEKRRRYEPYHVAWYQRQGTRGSLRTTYGDPMVWARSKNFFLTAVVPIERYTVVYRLDSSERSSGGGRRRDGSMMILQIMIWRRRLLTFAKGTQYCPTRYLGVSS
ncbi:hypothetical protein BT69DRAFT_1305511 [Atractiella rhizophila]|nr:hypothetical protein BT69DRAFT_1305511 [Atractiella rhizophila]